MNSTTSLLTRLGRSSFKSVPSSSSLLGRRGFKATLPMKSSYQSVVDKSIKEDFISVWSKSYCPFCRRAKSILEELELPKGKQLKVFELNEMDDGMEMQDYLEEISGQRSVPNIWINGQHLGGCDDLIAAQLNGQLDKLMRYGGEGGGQSKL